MNTRCLTRPALPLLITAARFGAAIVAVLALAAAGSLGVGRLVDADLIVTGAGQYDGAFGDTSAAIELVDANRRLVAPLAVHVGRVSYTSSPDRRFLAYAIGEGDSMRCQARDLADATRVMWSSDVAERCAPVWSGDSRRLVSIGEQANSWTFTIFDIDQRESRAYTVDISADYWYPSASPDGESIAFFREYASDWWLSLLNLTTGAYLPLGLIEAPIQSLVAEWSADGRWLSLYADQSGDAMPSTLLDSRTGAFQPLDDSAARHTAFRWSPDGSRLIFQTARETLGGGYFNYQLMMWDDGVVTAISPLLRQHWNATWSPDGQRVAFFGARENSDYDLSVYDTATGEWTTLVENSSGNLFHNWSPDGRFLAFIADQNGLLNYSLYNIMTGETRSLLQMQNPSSASNWSPDSRFLYIPEGPNNQSATLHVLDLQTGVMQALASTLPPIAMTQWTPDGRLLVFAASSPPTSDGFIVNLEALTITSLGSHPPPLANALVWTPDGQRFVYMSEGYGNRDLYLGDLNRLDVYRLTDTEAGEFWPLWAR